MPERRRIPVNGIAGAPVFSDGFLTIHHSNTEASLGEEGIRIRWRGPDPVPPRQQVGRGRQEHRRLVRVGPRRLQKALIWYVWHWEGSIARTTVRASGPISTTRRQPLASCSARRKPHSMTVSAGCPASRVKCQSKSQPRVRSCRIWAGAKAVDHHTHGECKESDEDSKHGAVPLSSHCRTQIRW